MGVMFERTVRGNSLNRKKFLGFLIVIAITIFPLFLMTRFNHENFWLDLNLINSDSNFENSPSSSSHNLNEINNCNCHCPTSSSQTQIVNESFGILKKFTSKVSTGQNNQTFTFHRVEQQLQLDEDGVKLIRDVGSENFRKIFDIFNLIGEEGRDAGLKRFEDLIVEVQDIVATSLLDRLRQQFFEIKMKAQKFPTVNRISGQKKLSDEKTKIMLASVACGKSRNQVQTMLKSALIGSQDAHLHAIIFSDKNTILDVGADLLTLKWTVAELDWDFSFELHLDSFPIDDGPKWRSMWQPCSTQRLFFPSLLPHVDSVIFLDADTIVVSNLTEMWNKIGTEMKATKLAAMASNTEFPAKGWYSTKSRVPHYGHGGLNAGVMLMNLTQMRSFRIESRCLASHTLYREKIYLADQDLYNIIFNAFPEKLLKLSCTYNFNWVHCGDNVPGKICHLETKPGPLCFCKDAMTTGLHVVHGNCKTFQKTQKRNYPFLIEFNRRFEGLSLLEDSILKMLKELKEHFDRLNTPCFSLTSDALYRNLEKYLHKLYY